MKIPESWASRQELVQYVIGVCMASSDDRRAMYERRRRYFLYGQNANIKVKFNRLKSHLKLVASFLFSPDGLVYNVAPPRSADDYTIQQMLALQDDFNEDIHDSGLADSFSEAVQWALNFDTMFLKMGWNDISGHSFGRLVEPSSVGFWREDDPDFSAQQAINHRFSLDYDEAVRRLTRAGQADKIDMITQTDQPEQTGLSDVMQSIIISAVQGTGLSESITGRAETDFEASPLFLPKLTAPLVTFDETWIWDEDAADFRIFHSLAGGTILLTDSRDTIGAIKKAGVDHLGRKADGYLSKTNWFLEKQNPFVPITPYTLYNYAWGDAHMEDIIPLQEWSTERLTQIAETLTAQVDPLRTAHGMTGLIDEKMDIDNGGFYADDNPASKLEEHRPPMPPDLFAEFTEIGSLMMETSGLTEVVSGKGSGGARGGQQQKQMQITGGGNIRKVAVGLEGALVRMGDLALKLKMKNDDSPIKLPDGKEFVASQIPENVSLRVDGHSHSPLFTMETKELAAMMFKAQAIDREWLIRLLNPTQKQNLLHSLKAREDAEAKAHQQELLAGATQHKKGKK